MNLKLANLIVVQFGIFIGVMSWLAYSRVPSAKPPAATEMQEITAPIATGAPAFEARNQRPSNVDYNAEREQARLMAERSASLQSYYRAIAPEPYVSSIPADSPSYAEAEQEPAVVPSDYGSPQSIVYVQPVQTVVFSNRRPFANRCRSTPHRGAPPTISHQCPDRRNSHPSDPRIVSAPNVSPPSPNVSTPSPRAEGFKPREPVRQTPVTGSQQKRVAFPGSPGAARRSLSVP
jgi:hypothetical protein